MSQEGQKLGGGAALDPQEVRRRRLEALDSRSLSSVAMTDASNRSMADVSAAPAEVADVHVAPEPAVTAPEPVTEPAATIEPVAAAAIAEPEADVSMEGQSQETPTAAGLDAYDIGEFHSIMWDDVQSTDNDKMRWVGQGIDFGSPTASAAPAAGEETSRLELMGKTHHVWGLTQAHGGPCGILAAVQAELLRLLLFGGRNPLAYPTTLEAMPAEQSSSLPALTLQALAMAIAVIVARVHVMPGASDEGASEKKLSGDKATIVLPTKYTNFTGLSWADLEPWSKTGASISSTKFVKHVITTTKSPATGQHVSRQDRITSLANAVADFLRQPKVLDCFKLPGGVILLVMSIVCSRRSATISADMDDSAKLTSQFGHCSQELMNLMLTGQAVSNVFDNTMTPSGSLTCRGIQQRSAVGYLTQLESLRYCEVGGYYKNPLFPIWVVGSTSHFTVLFGDISCLEESKSDVLLEKCRRAFKEIDGQENGFISRIDLHKVYALLELQIGGDHAIQTLAASIEVSGADIILWDDFWKATSRLMTGATLESVLAGGDQVEITAVVHGTAAAAPPAGADETDEEMARRLANEWQTVHGDDMDTPVDLPEINPTPIAAVAAPASPPPVLDPTNMSDEDYARQLQAQWDAEAAGTSSVTAVFDDDEEDNEKDVTAIDSDDDMPPLETTYITGMEDVGTSTSQKMDFETFGHSFSLHHYNGLRGGTMTPFRVTRLTAEEAVGASIGLSGGNKSGNGGDLEDVIRTKWPSCMVNWLGKTPPYID